MRGYFAIGAEKISKIKNFGNLARTGHGFGASFCFTVAAERLRLNDMVSDTSNSLTNMPYYAWQSPDDITLPDRCQLVGIELTDDAIELPSFRHPTQAAYILGPERASLSPEIMEMCDHIIKIPTSFCLNVATAGAIVMYDRIATLGRFAPRPVRVGRPVEPKPIHIQGAQKRRTPI
ncbi:RNA methyltransferase [Maritalea mediterranea]|uniref:RNA methyltransferase n=1 Tax=Maritalea mediterranea TaxID=2909667 RepID=A0ABS9E8A8_9HYPH|nr:RNA methyltransferase [Maritalea mediterranea]MCF4099115.1 RNA methyltransferase [Maritalea mediterranea]